MSFLVSWFLCASIASENHESIHKLSLKLCTSLIHLHWSMLIVLLSSTQQAVEKLSTWVDVQRWIGKSSLSNDWPHFAKLTLLRFHFLILKCIYQFKCIWQVFVNYFMRSLKLPERYKIFLNDIPICLLHFMSLSLSLSLSWSPWILEITAWCRP